MGDPVCNIIFTVLAAQIQTFYFLLEIIKKRRFGGFFFANGKSLFELEPPVLYISIYSQLKH